ncbi:hypothetical protein [Herbaspirillum rubrisubalbicans]|uniref:hypothetical protein n=1 Tax=Herbaspirillum rubrisubalbicans TaxID=80842 RepID=UPI0012E8D8B5|nr:hypothetical protein [Herbaspirillum rubrisubalbicans]
MRGSLYDQPTLGASLRGLILLSSRAHGKAGKYSLFKDLASKGFGDLWCRSGMLTAFAPHFVAIETTYRRQREKNGQKKPGHWVPGLIHTIEEGGGDIVTCCTGAAKTSVELNIAKGFVRCNKQKRIKL